MEPKEDLQQFSLQQIPPEWQAAVMELKPFERSFPENLPEEIIFPKEETFEYILDNDPSIKSIPVELDKTEKMLEAAKHLKEQINSCKVQLQKAEEKRTAIAASAELIHGECDSQLSSEQHLDIFVKSIDSILPYFDNLEKISIDFKSPIFTVLSPDFSTTLKNIENGIRFFDVNNRFKDSRSYLLRYQSLQAKITEMVKEYITTTLRTMSKFLLSSNKAIDDQYKNDIYIKFKSMPSRIMNLYKMCEKTQVFPDLLNLYKHLLRLLKYFLSFQGIHDHK